MTNAQSENRLEAAVMKNDARALPDLLRDDTIGQLAKDDSLILAALFGRQDCLCLLLETVAFSQVILDTALLEAARSGHASAVRELLRRAADPTKLDNACLRHAARNGHAAVLETLFRQKTYTSSEKNLALRLAVEAQQGRASAFLLHQGADPNWPDAEGRRPLMILAAQDAPQASQIVLLLDAGADPGQTDNEGRTAADIDRARDNYTSPSIFEQTVAAWIPRKTRLESQRALRKRTADLRLRPARRPRPPSL